MKVPVKPRRKKPAKVVCKRVRVKGTKRVKRVCKPVKKRRKVVKKPPIAPRPGLPTAIKPVAGRPVPVQSPAAPPVTTPPQPGPVPPPVPPPASGVPVHSGPFGVREAQRLLWRAGFGPRPGEAEALAQQGLLAAVRSLTRPSGAATFSGPPVVLVDGTRTCCSDEAAARGERGPAGGRDRRRAGCGGGAGFGCGGGQGI